MADDTHSTTIRHGNTCATLNAVRGDYLAGSISRAEAVAITAGLIRDVGAEVFAEVIVRQWRRMTVQKAFGLGSISGGAAVLTVQLMMA